MSDYILEMEEIEKSFPGVKALDHISLRVKPGEIHALIGENGAGKSTLMKILAGAYQKDAGEIRIDGKPVEIHSVKEAQSYGISIIHQELNLLEDLTVAENIFLGHFLQSKRGKLDWRRMEAQAQEVLDHLRIALDARAYIKTLGVGQKQMVEVAKALSYQARILIMDEPTAPLSNREVETLFETIRLLKKKGVAVIYISHHLEEIMEICDQATVIRDGKSIASFPLTGVSMEEIVRWMVGRELKEQFPKIRVPIGEERLRVENLCAGNLVKDVCFRVRAGEILGIAGLVGAGRTETVRAVFGIDEKTTGRIYVDGKEVRIRRPEDAIRAGIGFATEDRRNEGMVLTMDVGQNITLASLNRFGSPARLSLGKEKKAVLDSIAQLKIKTPSYRQPVQNLSGGNQQKVVLAKWLQSGAKIMIFDEPTRGIDVGAKVEVYQIINELIKQGAAVVMISSELPEILGMSDRVAVMCQGRIAAVLENDGNLTQEKIMSYAVGIGQSDGQILEKQ